MDDKQTLQGLASYFNSTPENVEMCLEYTAIINNTTPDVVVEVMEKYQASSPKGFVLQKYSEKSFVVRKIRGEVTDIDFVDLFELGGKWNNNLRGGPGTIYSNYYYNSVIFYFRTGLIEAPARLQYTKHYQSCQTWKNSIVNKLPIFGFTKISGKEINRIIRVSNFPPLCIKEYYEFLSIFNDTKEYWPMEARAIIYKYYNPSMVKRLIKEKGMWSISELTHRGMHLVGTFWRGYWAEGDPKMIKKWIKGIQQKYPLVSHRHVYISKNGRSVYMYHEEGN